MGIFRIALKETKDSFVKCYEEIRDVDNIRDAEKIVINKYRNTRFNFYYEYYGGEGIPTKEYNPIGENWEVKYDKNNKSEIAKFSNMKDAVKFYKQKTTNKALWLGGDLLDCMTWVEIK